MFEVQDLHCERGGRLLFEGLSFQLQAGEALQIQGENGAGKSSLIKTLLGLAPVANKTWRWQNKSFAEHSTQFYADLIYIGHKSGVNTQLSAEQNLNWYLDLNAQSYDRDRMDQALKRFGLYGFEDIPAKKLSAGQQRRIALCRLLLEDNKTLWLLDEPLVSLDKKGIALFEEMLKAHLEKGGMAIYTSHQNLNSLGSQLKCIDLSDVAPASLSVKAEQI